jgi:hypothetical protein
VATGANIAETESVEQFIVRWSDAPASERANAQLFLTELCALLDVTQPNPAAESGYSFECNVTHQHPDGSTSLGRIDLYKHGRLVLEAKHFKPDEPKPDDLAKAAALATEKKKTSGATIATDVKRARAADISEILETLCALGRIHRAPAPDHFIAYRDGFQSLERIRSDGFQSLECLHAA